MAEERITILNFSNSLLKQIDDIDVFMYDLKSIIENHSFDLEECIDFFNKLESAINYLENVANIGRLVEEKAEKVAIKIENARHRIKDLKYLTNKYSFGSVETFLNAINSRLEESAILVDHVKHGGDELAANTEGELLDLQRFKESIGIDHSEFEATKDQYSEMYKISEQAYNKINEVTEIISKYDSIALKNRNYNGDARFWQ